MATGDIRRVDENATADFCGPHPAMRSGTSWELEGRTFAVASRTHVNSMKLTLTNVAQATIDLVAAGLDVHSPMTFVGAADGPTTLTLTRGPRPATVLKVEKGTHTYVV